MGLVSRIIANLSRVASDAVPIAAALAPVIVPGPLGFLASEFLGSLNQPGAAPRVNSQVAVQRGAPLVRSFCPALGVAGGGFSAPFRARNFRSGGSIPGRSLNTFRRQVFVGRDVAPCPPKGLAPTPQELFRSRLSNVPSPRFGRR